MNKILLVAIQTDNASDGGMESMTKICEALKDDFRWYFFTNKSSRFTRRWERMAGKTKMVDFLKWNSIFFKIIFYIRSMILCSYYRLFCGVDMVICNDTRAFKIVEPILWLFRKSVFVLRDTKPPGQTYSDRHWVRLNKKISHVVTLSDEMRLYYIERNTIAADRVVVIPSIVDKSYLDANKTYADSSMTLIGLVGAIREKKNQLNFITQCAIPLLKERSNLTFVFIGDFNPDSDEYCKKCYDAVIESGFVTNIVFKGHSENVIEEITSFKIVVVASQYEGLARAMIESMALGVPVVSFDVCSATEVLGISGGGFCLKFGDYEGVNASLMKLIDDPVLRANMGASGREYSRKHFSEYCIRKNYLSILR